MTRTAYLGTVGFQPNTWPEAVVRNCCLHYLRCMNVCRELDLKREIRLVFEVTGISDDWYMSTRGVIITWYGTPWSTRGDIGCTREHWHHAWEHLRAPRITGKQFAENDIVVANLSSGPGYHSNYWLFNDFYNSCIQFVHSSINVYSYPSTHSIYRLDAGSTWEQFKVCLKMLIDRT